MTKVSHPARPSRRRFLEQTSMGLAGIAFSPALISMAAGVESSKKLKVAAIVTEFSYRSHAHVILENFLEPYLFNGKKTESGMDVVSLYVDQFPRRDMARDVAKAYGIKIYPTIAEALRAGGTGLAVNAVLSIGEHGRYRTNAKAQVEYPRKRFFDEIVAEFRRSGATAPVFNDKHLSYRADWAREMVETAGKMGFGLMAASSVPLAERRPALELPPAHGSRKPSRCTAATWKVTTSTGWRCCSRWSNREPEARPGSRRSSSSMETGCGEPRTKAGGRPSWPMPPGRPTLTPRSPDRCERSSSRADSSGRRSMASS